VTLTDLLPVRLGWRERPTRKHRAPDEIERLQRKVSGAELLIKGLRVQLDDQDHQHEKTVAHQAEAELLVVQLKADVDELTAERNEWRDEALRLRARFGPQLAAEANATRVDVPPMVRDTSDGADQATEPINVRPLWQALNLGPTAATTNPGRLPCTWGVKDEPEPAA
jgi:septal ring factor EnvC (AmiA/AmiB activator)